MMRKSMAAAAAAPLALWQTRGWWRRALAAGTAWGLFTAAGLTALDAWRCGFICLDAAAATAAASIAIGVLTIGPLAALGRAG